MIRALLLLAVVLPASAQTGYVRVDADAGTVVVDGQAAGEPGDWLAVAVGEREVALIDDVQAWNPRRTSSRVTIAPGDSMSVALVLPRRVRVETLPIRGTLIRERADGRRDTLGTAPLDLDLAPGDDVVIHATLDGYQPARIHLDPDRSLQTVMLLPEPGLSPETALLPTERSTARRTLVDVGIGLAAAAAGAVAVHYKFRADSADDRYRSEISPERGDEALREEALRFDRYSAVALGAMQVGVGALAIRFVLR